MRIFAKKAKNSIYFVVLLIYASIGHDNDKKIAKKEVIVKSRKEFCRDLLKMFKSKEFTVAKEKLQFY